jgi:catechol 2,3-dioxygenase-like lactoylglutathione lyase family enzyme
VFGLRADEWAAQRQRTLTAAERTIPFLALHPTLPVHSVQESIAFSRDRLGFTPQYVSGAPPDFAIMARGEWSSEQAHIQLTYSSDVQPYRLFVMIGAYLDRLYEEYRQHDVMITRVPTTHPWGIRDFSIIDNNGHQITFGSAA